MNEWQLDSRLAADSVELGEHGSIQIRAIPAAPWPWLILVPQYRRAVEWFDLPEPQQAQLFELTMNLAAELKSEFGADKINIAAIGNVVAQLHVHIVARHQGDSAWPAPVWGKSYEPADEPAQAERLRRLRRVLG
ncbi:MAG: HIT family protein [Lysobacterales bacterium]